MEALGARWLPLEADIRDLPALRAAAGKVQAAFGKLDIVAAVASIQSFKPLLAMEDADWDDQIAVNLTGTAKTLRAFTPHLPDGGRVIVTSSTQGRHGTKFGSAYSASKWGLIGLAKSAAPEWGADNITVNVLVPGLIDTPLTRHRERYAQAAGDLKSDASTAELEQKAEEAMKAKTPLGVPWIDPADIAPTVAFLASDEARMVSGACFDVTGGDSANNL